MEDSEDIMRANQELSTLNALRAMAMMATKRDMTKEIYENTWNWAVSCLGLKSF